VLGLVGVIAAMIPPVSADHFLPMRAALRQISSLPPGPIADVCHLKTDNPSSLDEYIPPLTLIV
jgi:hypothetical protein